jgi:hypothetical protein
VRPMPPPLKLYVAQLHAQPILVGDTALIVAR